MFKHLSHIFTGLFFCLLSVGCSTLQFQDLFSDYTKQMNSVRQAQGIGDFRQAQSLITKREKNDNNFALSLLEQGRLHHLLGEWQKSQYNFSLVYQLLEQERNKAKLQLSKGLNQVGAIVSNDNAIAYEIPAYEESMMHSYQALNYVNLGDFEGALVEIRRANLVQESALNANKNSIDQAELDFNKKALDQSYPSMDLMIGDIKNGFQNAYTFYLSGIMYEAAGQINDAYIDYKKALEIFPSNTYLQQDVLRLATKLAMTDDIVHFSKLFGTMNNQKEEPVGDVVFLIEQGIINAKENFSVHLPLFNFYNNIQYFSVALPIYRNDTYVYQQANIIHNNIEYKPQNIVALQSLASKNLSNQLPTLVARQAVRLIAKEQLRKQMSKHGGDIGNILSTLYNVVSEQADTRSWLTLPNKVQIIRLSLPVGKQEVSLTAAGQTKIMNIDVNKNKLTLVNITAIGNVLNYHINNF